MSSFAVNHSEAAGKNSLNMRSDTGHTNRHVSSVIYKIRDHGPAILDGEFYKDSDKAVSPSPAVAAVAAANEPAASAPVSVPSRRRNINHFMLLAIIVLSAALAGITYYAYQQSVRVMELKADIQIYEDLTKNF